MNLKDHILILVYIISLMFCISFSIDRIVNAINELSVHYSSHNKITTQKTFILDGIYDVAELENSAIVGAKPVFNGDGK